MIDIKSRGKTINIPTEINELTPSQYEYLCFLSSTMPMSVFSIQDMKVRWLSYLVGIKNSDYNILKQPFIDELNSQLSCVDNFFNDNGVNLSTPLNLLKEYKGYKGPDDWLDGMCFGKFVECLSVIEASSQEADNVSLLENYQHIARVMYDIPSDEQVPVILCLHAPILLMSVWKMITTAPIEINGKKIDLRIIFKGSEKASGGDNTGWTGIIFEVASAGLFGTVKDVENTDLWDVLLYLYRCKYEYNNNKNTKP